jgi:hypothetical protein
MKEVPHSSGIAEMSRRSIAPPPLASQAKSRQDNLELACAVGVREFAQPGVSADSIPHQEYEETMNKAKAMLKAVELAERGF